MKEFNSLEEILSKYFLDLAKEKLDKGDVGE